MVESIDNEALDGVFRALSDRTRRAVIAELSSGERSVTELAEPFDMSLAAVSKHLKALEDANLIERTVTGRTHTFRVVYPTLEHAYEWLRHYERFWNARLDALESLLRAEDAAKLPPKSPTAKSPKKSKRKSK